MNLPEVSIALVVIVFALTWIAWLLERFNGED